MDDLIATYLPYFDAATLKASFIYSLLTAPAFMIMLKRAGLAWGVGAITFVPFLGIVLGFMLLAHQRWTTVPKLTFKAKKVINHDK